MNRQCGSPTAVFYVKMNLFSNRHIAKPCDLCIRRLICRFCLILPKIII